ncbi:MAG: hypothetical protein WC792_04210 [Candidatus Micrarchaeia archaeon]|jgi:hypothetical protein
MDILQIAQFAGGALLFCASGYAVTLAVFKKGELDALEQIVFGLSFAMMIPTMLLLFSSMVLGIKASPAIVYAAYLLVGGAAYYYATSMKKD